MDIEFPQGLAPSWAMGTAPRAIPAGVYNPGVSFPREVGEQGGPAPQRAKLQTPPPIPRAPLPGGAPEKVSEEEPAEQSAKGGSGNAGVCSPEFPTTKTPPRENPAAAAMFFAEEQEGQGDRPDQPEHPGKEVTGTHPHEPVSPHYIELADLTVGAWDHSIVSNGFDPQAPPYYQFHPAAEPVRFVPDDALRRTAYWSLLTRDKRLQASALQDKTPIYLIGDLQTLHTDVAYETSGLSPRDRVGMMCRTLFNRVEIDYDRRRLATQVLSSDEWRELEWQRRARAAAARVDGEERRRRTLRRSLAEYIREEQGRWDEKDGGGGGTGGKGGNNGDPFGSPEAAGPSDPRAAALESLDRLSDDQIARYARRFPRGKERFVCETDKGAGAPVVPSVHWAPESLRGAKSLPRVERGAGGRCAGIKHPEAGRGSFSGESDSGGGSSPFDGLAPTPVGKERPQALLARSKQRRLSAGRRWPRGRPGARDLLAPPVVEPSLGEVDGVTTAEEAPQAARGSLSPQPPSLGRTTRLTCRIPGAPVMPQTRGKEHDRLARSLEDLREEQARLTVTSTSAARPPSGPPEKLPQIPHAPNIQPIPQSSRFSRFSRFSPQRAPLASRGGMAESFPGQPQGLQGPGSITEQEIAPVVIPSLEGSPGDVPEDYIDSPEAPAQVKHPRRPKHPEKGKPGTPQSAGEPRVPQLPDLRVEDLGPEAAKDLRLEAGVL